MAGNPERLKCSGSFDGPSEGTAKEQRKPTFVESRSGSCRLLMDKPITKRKAVRPPIVAAHRQNFKKLSSSQLVRSWVCLSECRRVVAGRVRDAEVQAQDPRSKRCDDRVA